MTGNQQTCPPCQYPDKCKLDEVCLWSTYNYPPRELTAVDFDRMVDYERRPTITCVRMLSIVLAVVIVLSFVLLSGCATMRGADNANDGACNGTSYGCSNAPEMTSWERAQVNGERVWRRNLAFTPDIDPKGVDLFKYKHTDSAECNDLAFSATASFHHDFYVYRHAVRQCLIGRGYSVLN